MKRLVFLTALASTGCTTQQPPPPPPAPVALVAPVPKVHAKPACNVRVRRDIERYADLDAASASDVFKQVAALHRGIAQRDAREKKLEAAIRSCGGLTK
ncbi:MAG: hypothetical protein JWR77_2312 [Rhizorhabdus sp.]|nr:hypothetical protein [Rhizorhabdus sp.]